MDPEVILVTGATGYVGGRLVPRLLASRAPRALPGARPGAPRRAAAGPERSRSWPATCSSPRALPTAFEGVDVAYYLVHSMAAGHGFHERDVTAARAFAAAAARAGVRRVVYLGGLGDPDADLSQHLRSRQETGDALRESGVPVTEFRAAVVVGAGSISFEMIRYLTERLPVMICPQWVFTRVQPIAVADVLDYLVAALDAPESAGRVVQIGGADVLTYGEMMHGYARVRAPAPPAAAGAGADAAALVVLGPSRHAHPRRRRPAADRGPAQRDRRARRAAPRELFPDIRPVSYEEAVRRAVAHLEARDVETAWSDALVTSQGDRAPVTLGVREGLQLERRQTHVAAAPDAVFAVIAAIGGERGYPVYDWAWEVRGALDRLVGGVGLRRGRRDPDELRPGDALDFWRVEAVEPGRLLRLRAEMKVPGRAWLEFETRPEGDGTRLVQTAYFAPARSRRAALLVRALPGPRAHLLGYDARAGRCRRGRAVAGRRRGGRRGRRLDRGEETGCLTGRWSLRPRTTILCRPSPTSSTRRPGTSSSCCSTSS